MIQLPKLETSLVNSPSESIVFSPSSLIVFLTSSAPLHTHLTTGLLLHWEVIKSRTNIPTSIPINCTFSYSRTTSTLHLCLGAHPLLFTQEFCFYNFFCIFNFFLFTGYFLQEHTAIPLIFRTIKPKPNIFNPTFPHNYNPIFLLLTTAKLLERAAGHLHFTYFTSHLIQTFRRLPTTSMFRNPMLYSLSSSNSSS